MVYIGMMLWGFMLSNNVDGEIFNIGDFLKIVILLGVIFIWKCL